MRRRATWRTATVVVVVGTAAWACDTGEMVSDAMVDAGRAMIDGGSSLVDAADGVRDGSTSDASAQAPLMPVSCDLERTWRRENTDRNSFQENTSWWAELRDPSISPESVAAVRVLACDREVFGEFGAPVCLEGETCTEDRPPPEPLRCWLSSGAEIGEGVVRWPCGHRVRAGTLDGTGEEFAAGQRWTMVQFRIER